jgi:hypothetical protein
MKRYIIISLIIIFTSISSYSQEKIHMAGVSYGYIIGNVNFDPPVTHKSVITTGNFSLLYNYYHDLWGSSPYFGFQTGISRIESGYEILGDRFITEMYRIPLVSQFHIDFWKMRLLINLGAYGAFRSKLSEPEGSSFDPEDNRLEFGIIGGGGLAFVVKPFEIHLEANYNHSLTYLSNPRKGGVERPQYSHPNHLIFSASLFFHIKSK